MESQRYQNMFGTEVLSGSGHIFGPSLGIISGSVSVKTRTGPWHGHSLGSYQMWPRILSIPLHFSSRRSFETSSSRKTCNASVAVTSHVRTIQNCFWPNFTNFRQDNFLWGKQFSSESWSDDAASWCSLKYLLVGNFTSFGNLETKLAKVQISRQWPDTNLTGLNSCHDRNKILKYPLSS